MDNQVLIALGQATSDDVTFLKAAEERLATWETQPGFYECLANILVNYNLEWKIRWLATVYLKNGVDRYWRKSAPNAIPESEKNTARLQLQGDFIEPFNQIAVQKSLLIAKIARLDCPTQWPELLPLLLQAVQSQQLLTQGRSLLTLYRVVKELSTKCLPNDKCVFRQLTSDIFVFLQELWSQHLETWVATNGERGPLELSFLCLKLLRTLLIHGFSNISSSENATIFINKTINSLPKIIQYSHGCSTTDINLIGKYTLRLSKVLIDLSSNHTNLFYSYAKNIITLIIDVCFSSSYCLDTMPRTATTLLNIMKQMLLGNNNTEDNNYQSSLYESLPQANINDYLSPDTVSNIVGNLITRYMVMTNDEISSWEADGEDYFTDSGDDGDWMFSVRPCATALFLAIFKNYLETCTPLLYQMLQSSLVEDATQLIRGRLLEKDCVYQALGHACYDIADTFDFDGFFQSHLVHDMVSPLSLPNDHVINVIVQRRSLWLAGQWIQVKLSRDNQAVLLQTCMRVVSESNDVVVKLTACNVIGDFVDSVDFDANDVSNYIDSLFVMLHNLLQTVREGESKMHVLHVMSLLIQRLGPEDVRPHLGVLAQTLPRLWLESKDHNMLRCCFISTLSNLVSCLGESSACLHADLIIPALQLGTDISQPPSVYLIDDSMELWYMTLAYSQSLTPELLQLFSNLPLIMETNSELLNTSCGIIECYLLLEPVNFLAAFGETVFNTLTYHINDVKHQGKVMLLRVVSKLVEVGSPAVILPILYNILCEIMGGETFPQIISLYIYIVSLVVIQTPELYMQLLAKFGESHSVSCETVLVDFVKICLDNIDSVVDLIQRKTMSLAALRLFSIIEGSIVLDSVFPPIVYIVTHTLYDVYDTNTLRDSLSDESVIRSDLSEDTLHDKRRLALMWRQPARRLCLLSYLRSQLEVLAAKSDMGILISGLDSEIKKQLDSFLTGNFD